MSLVQIRSNKHCTSTLPGRIRTLLNGHSILTLCPNKIVHNLNVSIRVWVWVYREENHACAILQLVWGPAHPHPNTPSFYCRTYLARLIARQQHPGPSLQPNEFALVIFNRKRLKKLRKPSIQDQCANYAMHVLVAQVKNCPSPDSVISMPLLTVTVVYRGYLCVTKAKLELYRAHTPRAPWMCINWKLCYRWPLPRLIVRMSRKNMHNA